MIFIQQINYSSNSSQSIENQQKIFIDKKIKIIMEIIQKIKPKLIKIYNQFFTRKIKNIKQLLRVLAQNINTMHQFSCIIKIKVNSSMNFPEPGQNFYIGHNIHDDQINRSEQRIFNSMTQLYQFHPSNIHLFKEPQLSKQDDFYYHLSQIKELVVGNLLSQFIKSYKLHQNKIKWNLEEVFLLLKFILRQKGILTQTVHDFLREIMHVNAKKIFLRLNKTMEENLQLQGQRLNQQPGGLFEETTDWLIQDALDMESRFENNQEFINYISKALRDNQCNLYQ